MSPQLLRLHKLLRPVAVVNQLTNYLLPVDRSGGRLSHLCRMLLQRLLRLNYRSIRGGTWLDHEPTGQGIQHRHRSVVRRQDLIVMLVVVVMLAQSRRTDEFGALAGTRIDDHRTAGGIRGDLNGGATHNVPRGRSAVALVCLD